jgi:hypothetical protein
MNLPTKAMKEEARRKGKRLPVPNMASVHIVQGPQQLPHECPNGFITNWLLKGKQIATDNKYS